MLTCWNLRACAGGWLVFCAGRLVRTGHLITGRNVRLSVVHSPIRTHLDLTFCALAALNLHNPLLIDAEAMTKVIKILLSTEKSVGGPYRTWLVPPDSEPVWLDVDIAVNCNVAYCLTLLGSPLPKLSSFIDDAIIAGSLRSPYYPSDHMTAYYMARGYNGQHKARLIKIIRALLVSSDTDLERALCVSSLLRLDPASRVGNTIAKLMKTQDSNGAWPAATFCLDPAISGRPYYNGAAALTTAFVRSPAVISTGRSGAAGRRRLQIHEWPRSE